MYYDQNALKADTTSGLVAFVGYELITGGTAWSTAAAANLAGGVDFVNNSLASEARNFIISEVLVGGTAIATAAATNLAGGVDTRASVATDCDFDVMVLVSETSEPL